MKKLPQILCLFIFYGISYGQNLPEKQTYKNQFVIHYYPSALLTGDISFGIEHLYKKSFAHELSFNVKTFQSQLSYFDRGYRSDYLIKYYLYKGNRFRFSTHLSFEYKNVWFANKNIEYHYVWDTKQQPKELYQVLREDRRLTEYGIGTGLSLNFKLFQHLSIGSDLGVNFVKYRINHSYKEIIYRNSYGLNHEELSVPSTYLRKGRTYSPLLRLKLSYLL